MTRTHVALGVLCGTTGGPAFYGRRLVRALAMHEDLHLTVITDDPEAFDAEVDFVHLPMGGGIDRLRWQHIALPNALARVRPDVYHDTKNALPWRCPVPAVVTVHDLAYHVLPETFGAWSRWFLKRATAHALQHAQRVIVPSAATAADVRRIYPTVATRMRVVPHGIDAHLAPDAAQRTRTLQRLGITTPFVLHVGTIQARKNIAALVRAMRMLRAEGLPHQLVLAGRRGWLANAAMAEIDRDDTALWLGEASRGDIDVLYATADAFASPSAYEGFGLAVADALAAGLPCVISDVSSLPEVCGDAAERIDELDDRGIAAALRTVLTDPARAAELRVAGPRRAAEFTWQRAAELTAAAYREALE